MPGVENEVKPDVESGIDIAETEDGGTSKALCQMLEEDHSMPVTRWTCVDIPA